MRATRLWLSGVLFTVTLAMALVGRADTPPAKPVVAVTATGVAPLAGPLKLQLPAKMLPAIPAKDSLDRAYEQFRQVADRARAARAAYVTAREQCSARSFSVQDQREAGCVATDTVAQCNEKLEAACTRVPMQTYRRSNRVLARASQSLQSAAAAYAQQVDQLPAED